MTNKPARIVILWNVKRILGKMREMLFYKKLDWNFISKPLKEDPSELFNIHRPTIEDYGLRYRVDGKAKTCYDWWYSAILKDTEEKLYFFILAFHPKWSFFRIIRTNMRARAKQNSLPKFPGLGCDFHEKIGYSEHDEAIDIWVSKITKPESSKRTFARVTIKPCKSHLILKTDDMTLDLNFTSLGMPFWINRGREAICSPKGDSMSGFYDVSQIEGSLKHLAEKTAISGVGINEHLMSFIPPERFWKRIDGIFFCTDQVYCAIWYLENQIEARRFEYKDGAVFIRATQEYLIPIDLNVEYLEFDNHKQVPIKIRIQVDTTKGKLNAVAEAIAETEKQLALKITDGNFIFEDGRRLRLTNGYGQHALH
ncbi:MAG: hypothetical protein ABSB28_01810 [Candidatus Bathyarchaeia archaeon]